MSSLPAQTHQIVPVFFLAGDKAKRSLAKYLKKIFLFYLQYFKQPFFYLLSLFVDYSIKTNNTFKKILVAAADKKGCTDKPFTSETLT